MMYDSKLVAALKVGGQILREQGDTVKLPFGAEYSVYLKNLNGVRAVVKVEIDGRDVLNGDSLVINSNSHIDLERFLSDDLREGRKFRFIERSADIEKHRGIEAEDGLIRVSFRFERPAPAYSLYRSMIGGSAGVSGGSLLGGSSSERMYSKGVSDGTSSPLRGNLNISTTSATFDSAPANDVGITVEGSKSTQAFTSVSVGSLEDQEHVIVLKLSGYSQTSEPVAAPITVATKKVCSSCGGVFRSSFEYCPKDATYLRVR